MRKPPLFFIADNNKVMFKAVLEEV